MTSRFLSTEVASNITAVERKLDYELSGNGSQYKDAIANNASRTKNISLGTFNDEDTVFTRDIIPRRGIFVGTGRADGGFSDFPVTIIEQPVYDTNNVQVGTSGSVFADNLDCTGDIVASNVSCENTNGLVVASIKGDGSIETTGTVKCLDIVTRKIKPPVGGDLEFQDPGGQVMFNGPILVKGILTVGPDGDRKAITCGDITTTGDLTMGGINGLPRKAITCGALAATSIDTTGIIKVGPDGDRKALKCGPITAGSIATTGELIVGSNEDRKAITCGDIVAANIATMGDLTVGGSNDRKAITCGDIGAANITTTGDLIVGGDIGAANITTTDTLEVGPDGDRKAITCGDIEAADITTTGSVTCGTITSNGKVVLNSVDNSHGVYIGSNAKSNSSSFSSQADMYVPLTLTNDNDESQPSLMIRSKTDFNGGGQMTPIEVGGISFSTENQNNVFTPQASINCIFGPDNFNGVDTELVFKLGDANVNSAPREVVTFGQKGDIQCANVTCEGIQTNGALTVGPSTSRKDIVCNDITCVNITGKSFFQGAAPISLTSYPYNLAPAMRRYRIPGIASGGGFVDQGLDFGMGQPMASANGLSGGMYMLSAMEENCDYGLPPIFSGIWYVEFSNFAGGKMRVISTVSDTQLKGSITPGETSWRLTNNNNQSATGVLILSQLQVG